MSRKLKTWLLFILIINLIGLQAIYFAKKVAQHRVEKLFLEVKNNDKLYVYETYFEVLNSVLYVERLEDTAQLINYYKKLEQQDTAKAYINFEIKSMPLTLYKPIYVFRYLNSKSNIIEMIDFNEKCWGYIRGYVYRPTTHQNPPSDSLIKAKEIFIRNSLDSQKNRPDRYAKRFNDYGWFCN